MNSFLYAAKPEKAIETLRDPSMRGDRFAVTTDNRFARTFRPLFPRHLVLSYLS